MADAGQPATATIQEAAKGRVAAELESRRVEVGVGYTSFAIVGLLIAVLGTMALLRGETSRFGSHDGDLTWVVSLMGLAYLLAALQLVASLLAHEHLMARLSGGSWRIAWVFLWLFRIAILVGVLAALWWSRSDHAWDSSWSRVPAHGTPHWRTAGTELLLLELGLAAFGAAHHEIVRSILWRGRQSDGTSDVREQASQGAHPRDPAARPLAEGDRAVQGLSVAPPGQLAAIGASGGGIRAAAFVLGGHQATQEKAPTLGIDQDTEPHVFAVSGGSYIATALALRRKFTTSGDVRPDTAWRWRETYATDSAELQWLRRHTRYLFEPGGRLRDGIVTLLIGAAVNIFLVSAALRWLVWLSAQLAVMWGFLGISRESSSHIDFIGEGEVVGLSLRVSSVTWQLITLPLVCLGIVGLLTLLAWWASSRFDSSEGDRRRDVAAKLLRLSSWGRPFFLIVACGWLGLVFVLPGATAGVAKLAAGNQPSTQVASALTGLGLVDEHICRSALLSNLERGEAEANNLAAINPGVEQSVKAGACGTEIEIKRTFDPPDAGAADPSGVPTEATVDGELVTSDTVDAMQDYVDTTGRSTRGRTAGIAVLLTFVAGLLRKGSTAPAVAGGRFAAVRRRLVTWLPLAIMFALACYLALLWSSGMYVHFDAPHGSSYLFVTVLLTAIASTVAFVVDANATSMHRYYRNSLASAFAVGVDEVDENDRSKDRARALPMEKVYRFSQLGKAPPTTPERDLTTAVKDSPKLHVVATLNTQEPGEAPTLRRGYPVVFSGRHVSTYRYRASTPVPIEDYEEFAGPGRVSMMATVGISGAAVSPIMGRFNEQMAPYRMLLALFNLRLGTWTRNPAHTPPNGHVTRTGGWLGFLWLTNKPGLVQMGLEAAGKASADQRWVYLSDGGHLDNTGLVECVRYAGRQGRVLVLDASNDPVDSWQATGDAIAVIKADLDIDLKQVDLRNPDAARVGQLAWARRYRSRAVDGEGSEVGRLDVLVVKAARIEPPRLGQKPEDQDPDAVGLWQKLPPNVQSFLKGHADFPRASTARQKFGDLEFEAYRALGYVATISAIEEAGWPSDGAGDAAATSTGKETS